MPYSDSARDYWKDPKMREWLGSRNSTVQVRFYEQYKNFSGGNGTNYSDWFRRLEPKKVATIALEELQLFQVQFQ